MQALLNVVGPIFENLFSPMSFGNRLNVGVDEFKETYHRWQDQYSNYVSTIRGFWNSGPDAWYIITDIENFYPTVSLEWLMGLIDTQTHDKKISHLIYKVLNSKLLRVWNIRRYSRFATRSNLFSFLRQYLFK